MKLSDTAHKIKRKKQTSSHSTPKLTQNTNNSTEMVTGFLRSQIHAKSLLQCHVFWFHDFANSVDDKTFKVIKLRPITVIKIEKTLRRNYCTCE